MKARAFLLAAASMGLTFCISLPQPARAKDALNFPDGIVTNLVEYLQGGGVGWSFFAREDLTLTEVGYLKAGGGREWTDAVVCVWAGTNGPIATFANLTSAQPTEEMEVVFTPVPPLQLAGGQEYRITLHRGSWPDHNTVSTFQTFKVEGCNAGLLCRRFLPASELQFLGNYIFEGNVFQPGPETNGTWVYVGPTFRFAPATPEKPRLQVLHDGTALVLSWPASAGVAVEACDDLGSSSWLEVTNGLATTGENCVLTNSLSGTSRFFRLRVR